eukprot:CFRG8072T1
MRCPLFVTWKTGTSADRHLRGCVGTFAKKKLHDGLRSYALSAAFEDSRFEKITAAELPSLHCTVSILTDFEEKKDCMDWELGIHGIWIEFSANGRTKTATYLPEVMLEQGWNRTEAIDSLLRKGGYRGRVSKEFRRTIKLTRYKSEKVSMTYADYVSHRHHIRKVHEVPLPEWIQVEA